MSALDDLKPIDRDFVRKYADPDSDTYSNGTQTVLAIKPHIGYDSASVDASVRLRDPKIQAGIHEILQNLEFADEVRAKRLKELASDDRRQTVEVYDGNGVLKQVIKSQVKPSDVAKLIDIANKMDGTYDRASAPVRMAEREHEALLRMIRKQLADKPTPRNITDTATQALSTTGEEGHGIEGSEAPTAQQGAIEGIQGERADVTGEG